MEFTVDKTNFLNALNLVKLALPSKTPMQILKSIMIIADDNQLVLRATDNTIDITALNVKATVKKNGVVCIDGLIVSILPKFEDGEIKFKLKDDKLTISQGKRRETFTTLNPDNFPPKLSVDNYAEMDVDAFRTALSKLYFVTKVADKEILEEFYFNQERGYVIAADGFRALRYNSLSLPGQNLTINAKNLMDVLQYIRDLSKIEVSLNRPVSGIRGQSELMNFEACFAISEEEYSDAANRLFDDLLSITPAFRLILDKKGLSNILDTCSIYARQSASNYSKDYYVTLTKKGKDIEFTMSIPDTVNSENSMEILESEGEELEVMLHPLKVQELLNQFDSDKVEFRFFTNEDKPTIGENPVMILDSLNPQLTAIYAPTRKA